MVMRKLPGNAFSYTLLESDCSTISRIHEERKLAESSFSWANVNQPKPISSSSCSTIGCGVHGTINVVTISLPFSILPSALCSILLKPLELTTRPSSSLISRDIAASGLSFFSTCPPGRPQRPYTFCFLCCTSNTRSLFNKIMSTILVIAIIIGERGLKP